MRLPRLRFTVSGAMGAIFAIALGLAALRNANDFWAGTALLTTLALIGIASLGVIHGRGSVRARWLGFLLFSGGYFVLAFGPGFSEKIGPTLATTVVLNYTHTRVTLSPAPSSSEMRELIDQRKVALGRLKNVTRASRNPNDPAVRQSATRVANIEGKIAEIQGFPLSTVVPGISGQTVVSTNPWQAIIPGAANYDQFLRVGHCVFALLAGTGGAIISMNLHAKQSHQLAIEAGTLEL